MNFFRRFFLYSSLCLFSTLLHAQEKNLLQKAYHPSFTTSYVRDFINEIKKQTGIYISFSSSLLDANKQVSITGNEKTVEDVLKIITSGINAKLTERGDKILIVPADEKKQNRRCVFNGYVKDAESKEIIIGAIIGIPSFNIGTSTNNYGFYSIEIPQDNCDAIIFYPGYEPDTIHFSCGGDKRLDILMEQVNVLEEVKVHSEKNTIYNGEHTQLSVADINKQQALLGQKDVLRTLQMLPGVQSATEGSSSIIVRGGSPGQNLFLLDGVPLYYVDHLFGLTSVYNADAIKSVDFYKGAFPSQYGDRLSSVVDVHTKDGDMERLGGEFTMGFVTSSLNLEGPIVKDKASFMISARRTWVDALLLPFSNQLSLNFYDINAKGNWIINNNNRIYLSLYTGRDEIRYSQDDAYLRTRYGNTVGSIKYTAILNPKFFLNTILTYSQFRYELKDKSQTIDTAGINNDGSYVGISTISEAAVRLHGQWFPAYHHKVELGCSYVYSKFTPTKIEKVEAKIPIPVNPVSNDFRASEISVYAEDEIKLGKKFLIRPGIHYTNWFDTSFNYSSFQPRLYAAFNISEKKLVYASVTHMAQFLHLISNNSYGLPTDFWVPSTDIIKPEQAWLGTIGYGASQGNLKYNVEAYYKGINGVITYTTGKNIFDNSTRWQNKLIQGHGWSYGLEFSATDKWGPLSASLAYTYSWSWRRFEQINNGDAFPYRYDRRHNLKIGIIYKISKGTELGANWTYMSGEAFTLPDQIYPDFDNNLHIFQNGVVHSADYTYHYTKWNDYRLPSIHRLDLGISFTKNKKQHYERTWAFGIYNAYARPNAMFITLKDEDGTFKLQGLTALQLIPYISFKIKF